MLIRGALANALAFTGSSYLFHRLSADNINAERKRHDAATEALQKVQIGLISLINNSGQKEKLKQNSHSQMTQ